MISGQRLLSRMFGSRSNVGFDFDFDFDPTLNNSRLTGLMENFPVAPFLDQKTLSTLSRACRHFQPLLLQLEQLVLWDDAANETMPTLSQLNTIALGHGTVGPRSCERLAASITASRHRLLHVELVDMDLSGRGVAGCLLGVLPSSLRVLRLVDNRLDARDAKAVEGALTTMNHLRQFHLRDNHVGHEGIKSLVNGLQHCGRLESLHLANVFSPLDFFITPIDQETAVGLVGALVQMSQLSDLCLDRCNLVSRQVAQGIGQSLGPSIRRLSLRDNGFADRAVDALLTALPRTLTSLDLGDNRCMYAISVGFPRALDHLSLRNLDIDPHSIRDQLSCLTALTCLDLSGNHIGQAGDDMLRHLPPNITDLDCSYNCLDDSSVRLLADTSMSRMKKLRRLDVAHNIIGDAGAEALAIMLDHHPTLVHLDVSSNLIGPYGMRALKERIEGTSCCLYAQFNRLR